MTHNQGKTTPSDIEKRLAALETEAGTDDDDGPPPEIMLYWPEDVLTPEQKAEQRRVDAWYAKHGAPKEFKIFWPDGTEALAP